MRQMERRGNPSGRRSSATFSKNALTLLPFTLFMSWWTPATSKHMRQRRMDCLTGLLPWRGGTVVFNWWDPSKRKLSFCSSRRLKRQAYTGCIPPGPELLSLLLWWLSSLVSTSSCWTVIACQLPSSRQPDPLQSGPHSTRNATMGSVRLSSLPFSGHVRPILG